MNAVNVTELRAHLPRYLSSVQKGAEILVTLHGQVIARILPPADKKNMALAQLQILRKQCKVLDVVSPISEVWDADK
jgi:prevent-host-death family protein